jgi:hypothetical protein
MLPLPGEGEAEVVVAGRARHGELDGVPALGAGSGVPSHGAQRDGYADVRVGAVWCGRGHGADPATLPDSFT